MADPCRIAVTGMACIFPGAGNLAEFKANLENGYDAITEVPQHRWDPVFYDPESTSTDRFYCCRGGFIDENARFDPFAFGIMPVAAEGAEPDQLLSLKISYDALLDAGYDIDTVPGQRTGIILGRGNYIGSGMVRLEQNVRTAQQLVTSLKELIPGISEAELNRVKTEFQKKLGNYGPDTAIGLVPNLTASRVANRLNFCGPAYTIDAACASSLMAIDQAAKVLAGGECDLMLAGGVHLCHDVSFWSVFTQLGILSRSGNIKPFDSSADGVLIGEGIGVVVLKRYDDAVADGDRIYSVINGIGVSSDGKASSLMLPDVNGQTMALERAWGRSGCNPRDVGYIEAHGTGAPAGDMSELQTLTGFFGLGETSKSEEQKRPGLGSVKSMIGHCMPAAGVAGFIKTALGLYHKKIYPTLHCTAPNEELKKTGFRIIPETEDWDTEKESRIAGVNAFGFGGINVHIVMSEYESQVTAPLSVSDEERIRVLSASTPEEMLVALETGLSSSADGPCRLVIFNPDAKRIDKAKKIISRNLPWRGRGDIWYSPAGLATQGGRTAFVFPGVDSSFEPKLDDVADFFNRPLPGFLAPGDLEETGVGIIWVNQFINAILNELGVKPDVVAGHSIGEWSGMIATGIFDPDGLDAFIKSLEAGSLEVPDVAFAAAGCDIGTAESFFSDLPDICVSNDNCHHQVILCGIDSSVDSVLSAMKKKGIFCQKLPFRSGFHSPLYTESLNIHREKVAGLELGEMETPLWSATTLQPYPAESDELKKLIIDHLIKPVRFRELILKLYEEGVRIFIQPGTGSLTGFIQDILKGKEFSAVAANTAKKTGMAQLRRTLAAAYIEGLSPDLEAAGMRSRKREMITVSEERSIRLKLGVPLVKTDTVLTEAKTGMSVSEKPDGGSNPVMSTFSNVLTDITRMQQEVVDQWQNAVLKRTGNTSTSSGNKAVQKTFFLDLSVESHPYLIDHSLFPQPATCTSLHERYPVVPMTMSVDILAEYAQKTVPGKKVVGMENIQAFNWIDVCSPIRAEIETEYNGTDRVCITIKGYLSGDVLVADTYPEPPETFPFKPIRAKAAPVTSAQLYEEGWMFHGPAYQGVTKIGEYGENGISGMLESVSGRGSLLDSAGQLFGYWVMIVTEKNRLAMPIRLGRIDFFADHPAAGEAVCCQIKGHPLTDIEASSDMELSVNGRVWAKITDWEDRRFDTDDALFDVMKDAGGKLLSRVDMTGLAFYRDIYKKANATNYISRRYCTESERNAYVKVAPKEKRAWLNRLIVVKDVVRNTILNSGNGPVFPGEISIHETDTDYVYQAVLPSGRRLDVVTAEDGDCFAAKIISGKTALFGLSRSVDAGRELQEDGIQMKELEDCIVYWREG